MAPSRAAGETAAPGDVAVPLSETLGAELVAFLACLHGQPDGTAETALSVLEPGKLLKLIAVDIIRSVPSVDKAGYAIVVTDTGRDLMRGFAEGRSNAAREQDRNAARAELERARREYASQIAATRDTSAPVAPWLERNAGLVTAIGIVVGVAVAVLVAMLIHP